jgi:hypothetical protein
MSRHASKGPALHLHPPDPVDPAFYHLEQGTVSVKSWVRAARRAYMCQQRRSRPVE